MDNERQSRRFESVFSKKVRAGKRRTYFFDVRRTKGEDYFLTLTESSKRMDGGYERHKIFLYKEDFNRFVEALEETVAYIKTELMPQYDYDEFARRQEEYEQRMRDEDNGGERTEKLDGSERPERSERVDSSEGFQKEASSGGFQKEASSGGFQKEASSGGFQKEASSGGFQKEASSGGFQKTAPTKKNDDEEDDMSW